MDTPIMEHDIVMYSNEIFEGSNRVNGSGNLLQLQAPSLKNFLRNCDLNPQNTVYREVHGAYKMSTDMAHLQTREKIHIWAKFKPSMPICSNDTTDRDFPKSKLQRE